MLYDVIILGSGPAGLTAAIYASRAFLKTALFTGYEPLGQLATTTSVENFPGFPEGVMGPDLMNRMMEQAKKFGTTVFNEEVTTLSEPQHIFTINDKYQSRAVIIATGASHKKLGLPEEEQFRGKGVSYCATCDAFFFRNKIVAVVGGGDTAMEEASFISKFASKVYLIHRRNEFRASAIMVERVKKNPKIEIVYNRTVKELIGTGGHGSPPLQKILLQSTIGDPDMKLTVDGLFVAIGLVPNTEFLKGIVELDSKGYVIKNNNFVETRHGASNGDKQTTPESLKPRTFNNMTSISGIFAAGDCADSVYRQAITAAGDGCAAALEVEKWLNENKD